MPPVWTTGAPPPPRWHTLFTNTYRPDGCSTKLKYALTSPMIRMPVMISHRELEMWPNTPIASPITSATVNSPMCDD